MQLAGVVVLGALLVGTSVIVGLLWMLFGELHSAGGPQVARMGVFVWIILCVEALLICIPAELASADSRLTVWLIGGAVFILTFVVLTLRVRRQMPGRDMH